jgi:hypothetical protein
VGEMMRAGLTDSHIIFNWLSEMGLEMYYESFVKSGYDLLTMMKATPADLSAIGILDPSHRNLIKQSMLMLDVSELEDKLNKFLMYVNSTDEMLKLIHLEQYAERVRTQQSMYKNFDEFVTTFNCEDLEELGIEKLGHQKKLMIVIKKLKDNMNQKSLKNMLPPPPPSSCSSNMMAYVKHLASIPDEPPTHLTRNAAELTRLYEGVRGVRSSSNNNISREEFNPSERPVKKQPPLPPRVSSVIMQPTTCSYATMPRKKPVKKSIESTTTTPDDHEASPRQDIDSDHVGGRAMPTAQNLAHLMSHLDASSLSNPTSPMKMKQHLVADVNSMFVPPTPPAMPLINLPGVASVHKITSKRMSPFASNLLNNSNLINLSKLDGGSMNQMNLIDGSFNGKMNDSSNELRKISNNLNTSLNNSSSSKQSGGGGGVVLNDLDSMLCDLNKQLDAMLDVEKFRNSDIKNLN